MQVVSWRRSLWIYNLIFTFLQFSTTEGQLSPSTSSPAHPAPTLDIYQRSKDSVVLVCEAPRGHQGVSFVLYKMRIQVDNQERPSGAERVLFTVKVAREEDWGQLFCCGYNPQPGIYSLFSPYLKVERQRETPPTSITPPPPPVLSVEPPSGVVKRGDLLTFSCSAPVTPLSNSQSRGHAGPPLTFLLLRSSGASGASGAPGAPGLPLPQATGLVSGPQPQPGVFTVGPVTGGESGGYSCIYQMNRRRQVANSTVSNMVQVTVADVLPPPTLLLHQETGVVHLLCCGSPSYPGAVFDLFLADDRSPLTTQTTKVTQHQATFPVPVQDSLVALYRCQYHVRLGKTWSHSELSRPLSVTKGGPPALSPGVSSVDWPLVLGSISAGVLFVCSVALVVVVAHRKVKAEAEKKKRREEAQFWTQVHAKDHVVDISLRRSSFSSQEWSQGNTESASRSALWNPLSTFTSPNH